MAVVRLLVAASVTVACPIRAAAAVPPWKRRRRLIGP
jgi:hypothetical protein